MTGVGIVLTPRDGARWRFDPGALFLEFLLTGGPGELAVFDRLHRPDDLRDWVDACRLDLTGADVTVRAIDVESARRLRDALWRVVRADLDGTEVTDADQDVIERAAAAAPPVPTWHGLRAPTGAPAVLSSVARDGLAVLTGPAADRLRECAAEDCRLVFLDTSRSAARRWCSMQRCGNRHKVRDHRARHQEDE
jgi:predicted RNA-binding Zn ribbon-like protein